jgi:hypothetical protein
VGNIVGPQGPQGPQGVTGYAGSVGAQGPQGYAGSVGAQGPQGVIGYTGSGHKSTTSVTAPASPGVGDIWYNSSTDVIYRYTYDSVGNYWLDITSPVVGTGLSNALVSLTITGTTVTTSAVTGALTVAGGVGIGGAAYIGGGITANISTSAVTLNNNSDMSFQLVSNTQLKISVRGSDGVTRSNTLTLA